MTTSEATKRAVVLAGGNKKVAEHFGYKTARTITQWIRDKVPERRVLELCELTKGHIQPHQLRPDFFEQQ